MKKILCVLMVALLMMGTALAEEEFTLHNGTKFGMTMEEVTSIESEHGFELTEMSIYDHFLYGGELFGKGLIANQDDTKIWYYFDQDKIMCRMEYGFSSVDTYSTVETSLIAKYGETDYSSLSGLKYPKIRDDIPSNHAVDYSHRLVITDNQTYVFIEHYTATVSGRSFHELSYLLLQPSEVDEIQGLMVESDDL